MSSAAKLQPETLRSILNELFTVGMQAVVAGILTAALAIQYASGEIPCPLCLLERAAMLGVCFGLIQDLRGGFSARNLGLSLLFSTFLLIVAVRQTLLDIYPRPGHEYVGTQVLGLHMPVWSVVIALALIGAIALKLCILGAEDGAKAPDRRSLVGRLATALGIYVIALAVVNLGSVLVQCGLGECHTTEYALLK